MSVVRQAAALGAVVLVLGSGVMLVISQFDVPPNTPNWADFTATTIGDTILLPVISACLFAAWRYLRPLVGAAGTLAFMAGGLVGLLGGAAVQASWLLDQNPRLTWVLPEPHRFSWQGWYHAGFLVLASGLVLGLASAVVTQLWSLRRAHATVVLETAAKSPLTIIVLASTWLFAYFIVRDGGQGASLSATVVAVGLPVVLVTLLTLIALGRVSLPSLTVAGIVFTTAATVVALSTARLLHVLAIVMAAAVAAGVALRDEYWRRRLGEYLIVTLVVAALTLFAIALSDTLALAALLICVVAIPLSVMLVTHLLRPWTAHTASFQFWPAIAVGALTSTLPVAAWLQAEPKAAQVVGNFALLGYSVFLMPHLAPELVETDTRQLLEREKADAGVTVAPALSEVASRVFLRAALWGVAAVCGILTVVVAAGPSMSFVDGQGVPSLDNQYVAFQLALVLIGVILTRRLRSQAWAPIIPVVVASALCWLSVSQLIPTEGNLPLVLLLPLALVLLWQFESIVANAAMRPSWAVRRSWRLPLGTTVGAATVSNLAVAIQNGTYGNSGEPVAVLLSFGQVCVAIGVNLLLVLAVGQSLDWRDVLADRHSTSPVRNWARYRLRNVLLMDFGLMHLVVLLGIWLPVAALARVDPQTAWNWVSAIMLACTGMLFFSPIFFLSLRNSVEHVEEQSLKASRVHDAWLLGSLPAISAYEERSVVRSMLLEKDGPSTQVEWARAIAVHQFHVNILALLIVLVSMVGVLPFANNLRSR